MKKLNIVELKEVSGGMSVGGFYAGASIGFATGVFFSSWIMIGGHSATKIRAVNGNINQINNGAFIDVGAANNAAVDCELGCGRRLINSVISAVVITTCTVGGAFAGGIFLSNKSTENTTEGMSD